LEFDLSPVYQLGQNIWTTVYFKHGYHQKVNDNIEDTQAKWILQSLDDARSRGFHCLPFQKIDDMIVNLFAPDPKNEGELYWLWQKVINLVNLFKQAAMIQNLTVRLQRRDSHDWSNLRSPIPTPLCSRRYDHDMVVVPFCTLQNLKTIDVETHSKELEEMIDWRIMDWAMDAVWDRSWNHCISSHDDEIAEHDVDRRVASDWFLIHTEL